MKVVFRVDATPEVGLGHLVRSMALAQALVLKGAIVTLVGRIQPPELIGAIVSEGVRVVELGMSPLSQAEDAAKTKSCFHEMPDWIVVDHYGLDATWEKDMQAGGSRCLVIDDFPERRHDCDMLLDQNLRLKKPDDAERYGSGVKTLLLGPVFALLRRQFRALRSASTRERAGRAPEHMFVCLGGGDVGAETCAVLNALSTVRERWPIVTVVVGASVGRQDDIAKALTAFKVSNFHVQTSDMAALMAKADCAITASGSISWERCCLGLPGLGISLADNQAEIALALHAAGAQLTTTIEEIPDALASLNHEHLRKMAREAAAICDGLGVDRVIQRLLAR